jgi:hypothetical protein
MRLRHRIMALTLAVAASGTGVVASLVPAQAATVSSAKVTVVHGIPNTPVTVYADGKVLIKDFKFGNVVGPVSLSPGRYAIAVRAYGTAATSKAILATTVKVTAGENATIVANLSATGAPKLSVFANPTSAPPMGDARVIVRHVAEAPGVDVYASATTSAALVTDLVNGHSATANVPAGSYPISVYATGTKSSPVIGPATLHFAAGKTYIVYAIGSATASPATITVAEQTY